MVRATDLLATATATDDPSCHQLAQTRRFHDGSAKGGPLIVGAHSGNHVRISLSAGGTARLKLKSRTHTRCRSPNDTHTQYSPYRCHQAASVQLPRPIAVADSACTRCDSGLSSRGYQDPHSLSDGLLEIGKVGSEMGTATVHGQIREALRAHGNGSVFSHP
mmetsp:Transcript_35926/g.94182  ORF Transcript_35926/g.94182 Transcript_35926/m.94182 type:complete len:162 (-) Transcript_35926:289-774(-)